MGLIGEKTLIIVWGDIQLGHGELGSVIREAVKGIGESGDVNVAETTGKPDLTELLDGAGNLLVVDTATLPPESGGIIELALEDFLYEEASCLHHQEQIRQTLAVLHLKGRAPRYVKVFGVAQENPDTGPTQTVELLIESIKKDFRDSHS